MPTQEEELRLTVNLVDNASAGLAKLREEMQQLGGGASGQAVEKFKRDQGEVNKVVKQFTGELGDSFKAFGAMRTALGAGATAVGLFGAEMMRQMNALKEYSDKIRAIGIAARQIGADPGVLRNLIDQFTSVGLSSDDVVTSLGNVRDKIGELQRDGRELWSKMVGEAGQVGSKAQASMNQFLQRLTQARSDAERLNMIREAGENIYQNRLRDTGNQQEAINARNQFWANLGYNSRLAEIKQVQELTATEKRRQEELAKAAKEYADALDKTKSTWSDIVDISNKPMLENLKATLDYINPILEKIRDWMDWWDQHGAKPPPGFSGLTEPGPQPQVVSPEARSKQGWWDRFWQGQVDKQVGKTAEEQQRIIEDNTKAQRESRDAIKELNDRIKQGQPNTFYNPSSYTGGGLDRSMVHQASFRMPSGGEPMFGGGGGSWGGGGGGGGGGSIWQGYGGMPSSGGPGFGPGRQGIPGREGGDPYGSSTGGPTGLPQSGPQGDPSVPSDILAQAKRVALESGPGGVERFMAQNGYPKAGSWCGEFAASVVKSVGGTPPKDAAIASNWRNWGTAVDTPQPGDIAVRRGARTGSTGSHVTFVESVDPKTGRFVGLGGNQAGGRLTSSNFRTSGYEFRRATGAPPNGQTAGPGTGAGAGDTPAHADGAQAGGGGGAEYLRQQRAPLTEHLQNDSALKKQLAALATLEHESDATAVVESLYNRTTALNEARAAKGKAPKTLREMMYGGFYGPAKLIPGRLAQLERDPARMKKMMDAIDAASTSNLLKGATDQGSGSDPNVAWPGGKIVRDGETYNDWGGGAGHEGNRQFRERQQAAIAAANRAQLDKTQSASTKVEGSGKISVDVNAPKGTKVDAEGGGLFKDVEVNRQTQMEPARRGPAASSEVLSI